MGRVSVVGVGWRWLAFNFWFSYELGVEGIRRVWHVYLSTRFFRRLSVSPCFLFLRIPDARRRLSLYKLSSPFICG